MTFINVYKAAIHFALEKLIYVSKLVEFVLEIKCKNLLLNLILLSTS